eukprot:scaffold3376_cov127-Isochrysis_galbana.AAC.5
MAVVERCVGVGGGLWWMACGWVWAGSSLSTGEGVSRWRGSLISVPNTLRSPAAHASISSP